MGWYTGKLPRKAGPPLEPGFVQFLATGDHLMSITRVCTGCGAVVATDYTATHRRACPARPDT